MPSNCFKFSCRLHSSAHSQIGQWVRLGPLDTWAEKWSFLAGDYQTIATVKLRISFEKNAKSAKERLQDMHLPRHVLLCCLAETMLLQPSNLWESGEHTFWILPVSQIKMTLKYAVLEAYLFIINTTNMFFNSVLKAPSVAGAWLANSTFCILSMLFYTIQAAERRKYVLIIPMSPFKLRAETLHCKQLFYSKA